MEQPLQPPDELGLRDPQLGLGRDALLGERQRQPVQLLNQLGCEPFLELLDGVLVDLLEPAAGGLVERCGPNLFEQLRQLPPGAMPQMGPGGQTQPQPDRPGTYL